MALIPLPLRLKAIATGVRLTSPEASNAFDRFISRMQEVDAGSTAPAIGEPMPDFLMPDLDGRLVSLPELVEKGPLVLAFLRGHWCPYCSTTASELGALARRLEAGSEGHVAVISPETQPFAQGLSEAGGHLYPVLTDIDAAYALSVGLALWIDDALKACMDGFGADFPQFNRSQIGFLPIPATFVLDRAGRVVFRDVHPDWRRRADPEAVLAAVRSAS